MPNWHAIVAGTISAVNPMTRIEIQFNEGYTVAPGGKRSPVYSDPVAVLGQVQELSSRDLRQLDGLNIQGSSRSIYVSGEIDAIIRISSKGGDLITMPDGSIWLTTSALEQWPDWCKVSVTLQDQMDP